MPTALLLVDVQRDMLEPPNPVPAHSEVRKALESLLARARKRGALVVHIQNDGPAGEPDAPDTPGWELVFPARPQEPVVRKTQSDAFTNADLGAALASAGVDRVVVAGMQSNYCVSATSEGALRHGLDVTLASGAHATYDEKASAAAISAQVERDLGQKGVKVVPFDRVRF